MQNGKIRHKVDKFETPNSILGAQFYSNLPKILQDLIIEIKECMNVRAKFSLRENDKFNELYLRYIS